MSTMRTTTHRFYRMVRSWYDVRSRNISSDESFNLDETPNTITLDAISLYYNMVERAYSGKGKEYEVNSGERVPIYSIQCIDLTFVAKNDKELKELEEGNLAFLKEDMSCDWETLFRAAACCKEFAQHVDLVDASERQDLPIERYLFV